MSANLDTLVDALTTAREIQEEVKRLREIERWAMAQQKFKDGDAAVIKRDLNIPRSSGWWCYREILVPGSTGTVTDIYLSSHTGEWGCLFTPDAQWSVHEPYSGDGEPRRYAKKSPGSFYFRLSWLRKRKPGDRPLESPEGLL